MSQSPCRLNDRLKDTAKTSCGPARTLKLKVIGLPLRGRYYILSGSLFDIVSKFKWVFFRSYLSARQGFKYGSKFSRKALLLEWHNKRNCRYWMAAHEQGQSDLRSCCNNLNLEGMDPEQLLTLCALAIEERNETVAQQAVCALRNKSSVDGEPSERVTAYFLQALLLRASDHSMLQNSSRNVEQPRSHIATQWTEKLVSVDELISLVDMTPYYRFGYVAANGALLEAFKGKEQVHILDFSTTHCMQWPTLIQALADRLERPPHVRLTVSSVTADAQTLASTTSPRLRGATYTDLGCRLTKFASSRGVPFQFHVLSRPLEDLAPSDFDLQEGECLGVNCAFRPHYLADETLIKSSAQVNNPSDLISSNKLSQCDIHHGDQGGADSESEICARDKFFRLIHGLNPAVVTLYEEDCDTTSTDVLCRLKESYEHEWIPFDFLATILPDGDENRVEYEKVVGRKIENIISCEGLRRVERLESKEKWLWRMCRLQFRSVPLREDVVTELKDLVADHASGWGFKVNVEDHTQSLTWKNHSLAFASAWAPV